MINALFYDLTTQWNKGSKGKKVTLKQLLYPAQTHFSHQVIHQLIFHYDFPRLTFEQCKGFRLSAYSEGRHIFIDSQWKLRPSSESIIESALSDSNYSHIVSEKNWINDICIQLFLDITQMEI